MTMYIFEFRNPVLNKTLKKVFWQFPSKDETKQWARLDPNVQKQVDWLFNPYALYQGNKKDSEKVTSKYKLLENDLDDEQKEFAIAQYKFAKDYNRLNEYDLNYQMTTYVDLKYQNIWGEDFIKEKKWEIKKGSSYFRLVK